VTAQAVRAADAVVEVYAAEVQRSLPRDCPVFDAHVHVGSDEDGASATVQELVAAFARHGVQGAFAFSPNETERTRSFRAANDRTLAAATESARVLVPYARLELGAGALEEAKRCLGLGARGLKLHTRAQPLVGNERELERVFSLAAGQRAPILVHGGLGMPPVADLLCDLVERTPDALLIVAHAGIGDPATFARRLGGHRGAFFDTSVWSPFDLLGAFAAIPPEQLLYGSDLPYGQLPNMLLLAIRVAAASGWSAPRTADMLGGSALRLAAGEAVSSPTRPVGLETIVLPIAALRVHGHVAAAMRTLWSRRSHTDDLISLALAACRAPRLEPALMGRLTTLLERARALWSQATAEHDEHERRSHNRTVFQLLHLADIDAVLTSCEIGTASRADENTELVGSTGRTP
jgi:predicted TIM-barrel fold metal-dependent hydrolase